MPSGKSFEIWVVSKVLSRWQKLWSRQRMKKKNLHHGCNLQVSKVQVSRGSGGMPPGKSFEIWASKNVFLTLWSKT